jgi:hypothetical protein
MKRMLKLGKNPGTIRRIDKLFVKTKVLLEFFKIASTDPRSASDLCGGRSLRPAVA